MTVQQNINVVEKMLNCFVGNDPTAFDYVAEDVVWRIGGSESDPLAGRYDGLAALKAAGIMHNAIIQVEQFEGQQYIAEGDKVVVIGHETIRLKTNNRKMGGPFVYTFTLNDGKIKEALIFRDDLFV